METMGERIAAAARGWVGTRFHHQGRLKAQPGAGGHKGGVDCLGLLVGVARELNLRGADGTPLAALDKTDYGHYPDSAALQAALGRAMARVEEELQPGDVVLLRVDGRAQHLAVVTGGPRGYGLVHAYAPARKVVEHALDAWWQARVVQAYRAGVEA